MRIIYFIIVSFILLSFVACDDSGTVGSSNVDSSSDDTKVYANVQEGSLFDERDGQVYRTVKIGEQVWMAENLNYATDGSESCDKGVKFGTFYPYSVAKTVCPNGWALPSITRWSKLITAVGGEANAGVALKSIDGCKDSGNGMDVIGFSVLPVEYKYIPSYPAHYEFRMERSASFWALNEKVFFSYNRDDVYFSDNLSNAVYASVRCVKENP
ncbi:FISUMP domain-containing protein [Fibrobacter sp.]|uniref:FISUMP domain-containing protein n=1 Tax=Fibrobacter sp. TaxID=35828 RepID=UPI0025C07C0B|nr:FISUMP domain-containing protein [Fibrobacter sp.]MBR4009182.1 hypothetical protein [Fibrobacter sp.]